MLRKVAASPHLTSAMAVISKSKEGVSNTELDDAINDSSEWTTLWVIRQLTALNFIDFRVNLFGNPARHRMSELGRAALSMITGRPLSQKPPTSTTPAPHQAFLKTHLSLDPRSTSKPEDDDTMAPHQPNDRSWLCRSQNREPPHWCGGRDSNPRTPKG